jgi:hypothetical protein
LVPVVALRTYPTETTKRVCFNEESIGMVSS